MSLSGYSDVTCDGVPEYVTATYKDGKTYLSYNGKRAEFSGYPRNVFFQENRISLYLDTDGDGEPDSVEIYPDCDESNKEHMGVNDVDCDGTFETVRLNADKTRNQTILEVTKGENPFGIYILVGYPVGRVEISPDGFILNLDTDGDGIADEHYGHECTEPEILNLPYKGHNASDSSVLV